MSPVEPSLHPDACYLALKTRDARFDGSFFTGVTSTGIYCRPVCKVRTPRRENCRFFALAAQAESAGFRPCLRCRPELAPQGLRWSLNDASAVLAQQAARLLDEPEAWSAEAPSIEGVAKRLGISDRHLRRIFEAQLGVSPLQYLQTRRLLSAKQLLADTRLPVTEIALLSGFASVRRFNAVFAAQYGMSPNALRREGGVREASCEVRLGLRPPYDVEAMLGFFRTRAIEGVEAVGERQLARTLALDVAGRRWEGWLSADFDAAQSQLVLRVSESLHGVLPLLIRRVRAAFDLDADPQAINARLHGSFPLGDGLRVPGSLSGYELAVRAVLGQQITVAAA
ncbi:MAG TPA: DNA-3-methyladenine glycosylase 2 family protein, partial [Ramlibacter sp.]|uniref:bifunctional transcriptional activator/DNA repair enzyme AdaA n=1 Tax=Ramlibacter sp. TaxID=1917967 RepID=UPI002D80F6ED